MSPDAAAPDGAPALPAEPRSAHDWFGLLYHELRRRARGQIFRHRVLSMGATTLLHETWLKLADRPLAFSTQAELVAYAALTMRSIVVNHLRDHAALKRGGEFEFVAYETLDDLRAMKDDEVLRLNDALDALMATDRALAELVELRFFAGLTFTEIAALRQVSDRTVQRDWAKARMLLTTALRE